MRFALPSGASVELTDAAPELPELSGVFAPDLAGVRAAPSQPLDELPLADLHTLRAIAKKLGLSPEPPISIRCRNCDHAFDVVPTSTFELGPYRDGELDDPELDAPFDFSREHAIDPDDERFSGVRLEPVSVGRARALHEALAGQFRVTSRVVRALGIVSLGGETSPGRIARRLREASDETFDRVAAVFEDAHYPPRLVAPHACPECAMVEWVPVPAERELTVSAAGGTEHLRPEGEPFMDVDRFEAAVRDAADRIYRELGVAQIDLSVIDGPAECDDGGEPLLGCYRPPEPEGLIPKRAEVRVFYRTFAAIWEDEGAYDVAAEIDETLRHELEHHFGHLAGDDPLDDDERAEIDLERARRVGRSETQRRALRAVTGDFGDFLRKTWPLWLLAAAITVLAVIAER
jgi:hypothetical protein